MQLYRGSSACQIYQNIYTAFKIYSNWNTDAGDCRFYLFILFVTKENIHYINTLSSAMGSKFVVVCPNASRTNISVDLNDAELSPTDKKA